MLATAKVNSCSMREKTHFAKQLLVKRLVLHCLHQRPDIAIVWHQGYCRAGGRMRGCAFIMHDNS